MFQSIESPRVMFLFNALLKLILPRLLYYAARYRKHARNFYILPHKSQIHLYHPQAQQQHKRKQQIHRKWLKPTQTSTSSPPRRASTPTTPPRPFQIAATSTPSPRALSAPSESAQWSGHKSSKTTTSSVVSGGRPRRDQIRPRLQRHQCRHHQRRQRLAVAPGRV